MKPLEHPRWFALQVKRRLEKFVALGLRQKGYEGFVPVRELQQTHKGTLIKRQEALFPGYVFCEIRRDGYGLVVTTPGVIRIVGSGSNPTPIDPVEIDSLRLSCDSGRQVDPCEFLNVGDQVLVEDGPLAGVVGILTEFRNEQRVVISVTQCMRSVAVEVRDCRLRCMGRKEVSTAIGAMEKQRLLLSRAI